MMVNFSVSLDKIVKQMNLRVAYTPKDLKEIPIRSADVNRPGLLLAHSNSWKCRNGLSAYFARK